MYTACSTHGRDEKRIQVFFGRKKLPGTWKTLVYVMEGFQGPLSPVSIIEELLGRNSSCSGLEIREYGREDPLR
jgi:hypothetical protein